MPVKWNPEDADFKLMSKLGGVLNQGQIAEYYGVSVTTIQNRFKRFPEFREAYDKSRAGTTARIAGALVEKALNGNLTAQIFYLKTQAGWWDKQQIEHTGAGGGAIEIETASQARREIVGRLDKLAARLAAGSGTEGGIGRERGELEIPEARMELLGEAGSVPSTGVGLVHVADDVGTGSGED